MKSGFEKQNLGIFSINLKKVVDAVKENSEDIPNTYVEGTFGTHCTMHCTQKFYNEDMNLRMEMAKHLISNLKDLQNDDNIFF